MFVVVLGIALTVIGLGVAIWFAVWPPQTPRAKRLWGTLAILLIVGGLVSIFVAAPVRWQSPIVIRVPFASKVTERVETRAAAPPNAISTPSCQLKVTEASRLTAKLYFRQHIPSAIIIPAPKVKFSQEQFEELFYDWNLKLQSNAPTGKIFVEVDRLRPDDAVNVVSANGVISPILPRWISGHSESPRQKPDYYARQITIDNIVPGQAANITVRHSLYIPAINADDLFRVADVRSANPCTVSRSPVNWRGEADQLNHEATMLTRPPGVAKIEHNVGDVPKNEIEATLELICIDRPCIHMVATNLVGREHPAHHKTH